MLEQADIDILFARVRALKARASFVFVSHRLDEVLALSDRIYVMKDGKVVAELPAAEADAHQLHQLMVGRGRHAEYYRESAQRPYGAKVLLAVEGLAVAGAYRGVDFALHEGEILGIAGVIGSGREALCRTLFGFEQPSAGRILVGGDAGAADLALGRGRPRHRLHPARAAHRGAGAVPAGRRQHDARQPRARRARRPDRLRQGEAARPDLGRPAAHPHARHPGALPQPLRRQPAEGGARRSG